MAVAIAGDPFTYIPELIQKHHECSNWCIRGDGLRAVNIPISGATNNKDAFILNGEVTIEDLTVKNLLFCSVTTLDTHLDLITGNDDSTGFTVTNRSSYIRNVRNNTRININSGRSQEVLAGDAGRGGFFDGELAVPANPRSKCTIQKCNIYNIRGVDAITLTNGARVEWLNSSHTLQQDQSMLTME